VIAVAIILAAIAVPIGAIGLWCHALDDFSRHETELGG
jgi:hypothetical protein